MKQRKILATILCYLLCCSSCASPSAICPAGKSCYPLHAARGKIVSVDWNKQNKVLIPDPQYWVEWHLVIDQRKENISSQQVVLILPDGVEVTVNSDEQGWIRIKGIPPGDSSLFSRESILLP